MAWELCSKTDVSAIIPVAPSALKDEWSDMVEGLIKQKMGTPYLGTSQAITAEVHHGDGSAMLLVRKPPIISVEAIRSGEVALVSTDYVVFPTHILLKGGQTFPQGIGNVEIDYTSGLTTVPGQVRLCAAMMIEAIYTHNNRMGADASIKWADPDEMTKDKAPARKIGLAAQLDGIMQRFLRRERIRAG